MPAVSYSISKASGVPVITAPTDIDLTNADLLRTVLAGTTALGHGTFVVDMTATRFCDSAGLHVLIRAHKRAVAEGGELRLVLGTASVRRLFALTGLDRVIPSFARLDLALAPDAATTAGATPPSRPRLRMIA